MIPVKQTVVDHNPKEGRFGTCFRASVASVLEVNINDIPAVERTGAPEDNYTNWNWIEFDKWLALKGYILMGITLNQLLMSGLSIPAPEGFYLVGGPASRGHQHCVVYKNGKLAHDPHPSGEGLKRVDRIDIFVKVTF